jgi:hypothetical protein
VPGNRPGISIENRLAARRRVEPPGYTKNGVT